MGTNYYLRSRRPVRTIVTHEGDEHGRVVGVRREYAECHLCKLSYGWRPLMACDTEATIPGARFTSLKEMMRFIREHADEYMVLDFLSRLKAGDSPVSRLRVSVHRT